MLSCPPCRAFPLKHPARRKENTLHVSYKKKAETFCSAVRDPNTTEQVSALQSVRSAAYPRRDDEPNSQAKLDAYSPVHKNELPVHIPFMIVPSALKKINAFRAFEEKNFNFVPMAGFMVNF